MSSQRKLAVLLLSLLLGMVLVMHHADARRAPEGTKAMEVRAEYSDGASYTAYPDVYEKMKSTLSCWMARLPAGPSPKGPGH